MTVPAPANQSGYWRLYSRKCDKCPPMAAFSKLVLRLRTPNLYNYRAKSAIVSGGYLKYSHFWETATGDRVQSTLRGRVCSATRQILRLCSRQIGNAEPARGLTKSADW